jgi:hypothetical protein
MSLVRLLVLAFSSPRLWPCRRTALAEIIASVEKCGVVICQ